MKTCWKSHSRGHQPKTAYLDLANPGFTSKTISFINLRDVSLGMLSRLWVLGAISILGAVIFLPFISAAGFGQEVNDFLWELQQNPSAYTLVFDLGISSVEEQSMIAFAERYKISRSRLDTDVDFKEPNLIVVGSPSRNTIIKRLGFFEDPSVTVNSAVGKKLVIASSNSQETSRLLQELAELDITKPSSAKEDAAIPAGAGQESLPSPEPQTSLLGKLLEKLSPGHNAVWILLLVIISPIFGVAVVRQVHRAKKARENKDRVKNYLATYLQRGYHPMYLRSYLLQQRWDPKIVDEAFSRLRK